MTDPNKWKSSFRNFPKIPRGKQWLIGGEPGSATLEQIITSKLLNNVSINNEERTIILECIRFYNLLYGELRTFDYSSLNNHEISDFILYIGYAFNFLPMHTNSVELFEAYRLVQNKDSNSKTNTSQVSYPPLEIVKKYNLYNRASSPSSTAFYCSDSIDVVFKEIKPSKSSIVTLGIWQPKNKKEFHSYPISSNPSAQLVNKDAQRSEIAYRMLGQRLHPLFIGFIDGYFRVLNYEYSKPVKNHLEYLISAYFSEKIFEIDQVGWSIDCIIYPSVGNEYSNSNLAFKPSIVDQYLELKSVTEIEIIETFYEKPIINNDPRKISVANVKILKKSKSILENGDIIWI